MLRFHANPSISSQGWRFYPRSARDLLLVGIACLAVWHAQKSSADVLLLRTGGILAGHVDRQGDHYVITTASRQIRLSDRDVKSVYKTLQDAYSGQRAMLNTDSAVDHIALAQWCIRHKLWAAAARELFDARRLDPRHPRLPVTEQRLAIATRLYSDSATPAPGVQAALHFEKGAGSVDVATAEFTIPSDAARSGRARAEVVEQLHPRTVQTFAEHIQPLLINTCTTSGCHLVGGRAMFQLDRLALGPKGNRTRTLENLQAVLSWIDREHPEASRLLIEASRAHGSLELPPLTGYPSQLLPKLDQWIRQACNRNAPGEATIDQDASPPIRPAQDKPAQ